MQYPKVAAIVSIRDGDAVFVDRTIRGVRAQRGATVELVLVDQTLDGRVAARAGELDAIVVREISPSRGVAFARGLEVSEAQIVLWWEPAAHYAPTRAAQQVRALLATPQALVCTSDLTLDSGDDRVERRAVDLAGGSPPALWQAGVALHRELLETIDRAAFAPAELALYLAARERGLVVHVSEALCTVPSAIAEARAEEARVDIELVRLAREAPLAEPLVTVLLATHERCAILLDCLAGFARQLVRPGTLEIIVVDDASTDETSSVMPSLATRSALRYLRQERPAGAAAARNLGLPHARGHWVLFVNDDTLPAPDLVLRHLEALRRHGPGSMVLGSFRQPDAILANALNHVLDASHLVFGYSGFVPGQELPGEHLYTCNCSVELSAVRAIGGFDERYSLCGGEDTDIGLRLVAFGQRLHFEPKCRAAHQHFLSFEDFRRRQRIVARAHVKLYRDHVGLLAGQPWSEHTGDHLRGNVARAAAFVEPVERAARHLGELDLGAIAALGDEGGGAAATIDDVLFTVVSKLHAIYWTEGLLDGFEECGLDGFPALLADAAHNDSTVNSHA